MAFEDMTYETLNARMMDRVTANYPELDTREGSMVFQAIAAAAMELSLAYERLDTVLNETFVTTASRDNLYLFCQQVGMDTTMFDATYGKFKGVFNIEVPIGSRWNLDEYNYSILESSGLNGSTNLYEYVILCETAGSNPNAVLGDLTPVDYISGNITTAKITECLVPGEDEATDEEIRDEYEQYVSHSYANGNVEQYIQWADEFDGIGTVKVFPLWDGLGTVKVSILDGNNAPATQELMNEFQAHLDPGRTGLGNGVAPIGAKVTVSTATQKPINISGSVKFKEGYNDTSVIDDAVSDYFKSIAYKRDSVPYMNIGSAIVNLDAIDFVTGLTIDGGTADIPLGDEEIPTLGAGSWTVVS